MVDLKNEEGNLKEHLALKKQYMFEVLKYPIITEKSTQSMSFNKYVFKVLKTATKSDIKKSVEVIFNVKVVSVNTLNQNGKKKRFRGRVGFRPSYKKASVRLVTGDSIDLGLKV